MNDTIPDWAIQRALDLCGRGQTVAVARDMFRATGNLADVMSFARFIAKHEQPPVDPDEEAVKRILSAVMGPRDFAQWDLSAAVSQYKQEKANG